MTKSHDKPTGCSLMSQAMKPVLQVLYRQLPMEVIITSRAARGSLRRPINTRRRIQGGDTRTFGNQGIWEEVNGESCIQAINDAYEEVVLWKRNLFLPPSSKAGKTFVKELARLYQAYELPYILPRRLRYKRLRKGLIG